MSAQDVYDLLPEIPDEYEESPACQVCDENGEWGCEELAVTRCDSCGAWLCEEHLVIGAPGGSMHHLCEDCC